MWLYMTLKDLLNLLKNSLSLQKEKKSTRFYGFLKETKQQHGCMHMLC